MTTKDYNLIAKTIRPEVALHEGYPLQRLALCNLVLALADVFAQGNPAFDRVRFYEACGLDKYDAPTGFALGSDA